ncbi:MAG: hydroxyacylglutathione hydrolase [Burkholderiaceae bacterium]
MVLHPVPAFSDNYIWVLHNGTSAVVVDPGETDAVLAYLHTHRLQTAAILVTHHHADHTGGAEALREATGARLLAPAGEWLQAQCERVDADTTFHLLGLTWRVLPVPGHTAGHVAYVAEAAGQAPRLFCGDTLFSGGCGRLFEGTPAQMLASLDALSALPDHTQVCCTHEYTLGNLRFARAVDPDNLALADWQRECVALRAQGLPTLPSPMAREREINPFLRVRHPALVAAARTRSPHARTDVDVFAALRDWKNEF